MKKNFLFFLIVLFLFSGCENANKKLSKGDSFLLTGVVEYSDSPSDIGEEYCFVKGEEREYNYIDIYGEEATYKSDTFYTRGEDTLKLKGYIGKTVAIKGKFDVEAHGIPYITDIKIKMQDEFLKTEIENVSIKISDVEPTGATLIIKDENEEPHLYGEWYKIEKRTDDKWCDVLPLIDEYAFHMLGYIPDESGEVKFEIDWEWLYGRLDKGHYRILKDVDGRQISIEFII